MSNNRQKTYRIAFIGIMAAMVCVVTYFHFPFLGSQVHFANAFCLLAGLLPKGRVREALYAYLATFAVFARWISRLSQTMNGWRISVLPFFLPQQMPRTFMVISSSEFLCLN